MSPTVTIQPELVDTKRSAGWLPEHDELEAWLDGHRERVEARSEPVVLHRLHRKADALRTLLMDVEHRLSLGP